MSPQPAPPAWDDALADAIAMVDCCRFYDPEGFAVLVRLLPPEGKDEVLCTLVKLLSELVDEHAARPDQFRAWAMQAVARS